MNFLIVLPAAVITFIIFIVMASGSAAGNIEVGE